MARPHGTCNGQLGHDPDAQIVQIRRWYCKYGISYRDLEEMMSERAVVVDHTTLFRWVQHYAPLMEKRIRWYQRYTDASWRVDETYVKVAGQWAYLCEASCAFAQARCGSFFRLLDDQNFLIICDQKIQSAFKLEGKRPDRARPCQWV